MLLTLTTTHAPATDLGYLLHKNPAKAQSFDLSFGAAHVFYPEATAERCTAALLLDVDPVALVRGSGSRGSEGRTLSQYVNDRPYVASSFLSVALAQVYGSALGGRCKDKPDAADTQMALAVGEVLLQAPKPFAPETLEASLREAFIEWSGSPDNNRAPGMTCMTACSRLHTGMLWTEATVKNSKGCGANMRVQAVGVLPDLPQETRAAVAQFQAALTHGHPTALAASDLTAAAIAFLIGGTTPRDLPRTLREYALSQRDIYHGDWLGTLWQRPMTHTPEQFIARGWDECLGSLASLDVALENGDKMSDPCAITGAGWIAEEALATGLLCFLLFPDDPLAVIQRSVVSSGDSDSIACLAGAFAGAYHGMDAWPVDWAERIEYRDRLTRLGAAWDWETSPGDKSPPSPSEGRG